MLLSFCSHLLSTLFKMCPSFRISDMSSKIPTHIPSKPAAPSQENWKSHQTHILCPARPPHQTEAALPAASYCEDGSFPHCWQIHSHTEKQFCVLTTSDSADIKDERNDLENTLTCHVVFIFFRGNCLVLMTVQLPSAGGGGICIFAFTLFAASFLLLLYFFFFIILTCNTSFSFFLSSHVLVERFWVFNPRYPLAAHGAAFTRTGHVHIGDGDFQRGQCSSCQP